MRVKLVETLGGFLTVCFLTMVYQGDVEFLNEADQDSASRAVAPEDRQTTRFVDVPGEIAGCGCEAVDSHHYGCSSC